MRTRQANITTKNRPDNRALVIKLGAMTRDELLAHCTKVVAKAHHTASSHRRHTNQPQSDRRALAGYMETGSWGTDDNKTQSFLASQP